MVSFKTVNLNPPVVFGIGRSVNAAGAGPGAQRPALS
jgi:hypothetical protein